MAGAELLIEQGRADEARSLIQSAQASLHPRHDARLVHRASILEAKLALRCTRDAKAARAALARVLGDYLGVAITVQHPVLYTHGAEMLSRWGPERTAAVMPVRSWLAEGVTVSAGSDTVRPVNPLLGVWGMVTRGTSQVGVRGADASDPLTVEIDELPQLQPVLTVVGGKPTHDAAGLLMQRDLRAA
jgi:Amidohydrolase family